MNKFKRVACSVCSVFCAPLMANVNISANKSISDVFAEAEQSIYQLEYEIGSLNNDDKVSIFVDNVKQLVDSGIKNGDISCCSLGYDKGNHFLKNKYGQIVMRNIPEKQDKCTFCLEEFKEPSIINSCGHRFHISCLAKYYIGYSRKCPVCRRDVALRDAHLVLPMITHMKQGNDARPGRFLVDESEVIENPLDLLKTCRDTLPLFNNGVNFLNNMNGLNNNVQNQFRMMNNLNQNNMFFPNNVNRINNNGQNRFGMNNNFGMNNLNQNNMFFPNNVNQINNNVQNQFGMNNNFGMNNLNQNNMFFPNNVNRINNNVQNQFGMNNNFGMNNFRIVTFDDGSQLKEFPDGHAETMDGAIGFS